MSEKLTQSAHTVEELRRELRESLKNIDVENGASRLSALVVSPRASPKGEGMVGGGLDESSREQLRDALAKASTLALELTHCEQQLQEQTCSTETAEKGWQDAAESIRTLTHRVGAAAARAAACSRSAADWESQAAAARAEAALARAQAGDAF